MSTKLSKIKSNFQNDKILDEKNISNLKPKCGYPKIFFHSNEMTMQSDGVMNNYDIDKNVLDWNVLMKELVSEIGKVMKENTNEIKAEMIAERKIIINNDNRIGYWSITLDILINLLATIPFFLIGKFYKLIDKNNEEMKEQERKCNDDPLVILEIEDEVSFHTPYSFLILSFLTCFFRLKVGGCNIRCPLMNFCPNF